MNQLILKRLIVTKRAVHGPILNLRMNARCRRDPAGPRQTREEEEAEGRSTESTAVSRGEAAAGAAAPPPALTPLIVFLLLFPQDVRPGLLPKR